MSQAEAPLQRMSTLVEGVYLGLFIHSSCNFNHCLALPPWMERTWLQIGPSSSTLVTIQYPQTYSGPSLPGLTWPWAYPPSDLAQGTAVSVVGGPAGLVTIGGSSEGIVPTQAGEHERTCNDCEKDCTKPPCISMKLQRQHYPRPQCSAFQQEV